MWELIFLMVVLKIPIVYLCAVVWWAIKAEPKPLEGAAVGARLDPEPNPWRPHGRRGRRPPRPRPHGGPVRSYPRTARAALVRTEVRR
jgi:hypothetical protein